MSREWATGLKVLTLGPLDDFAYEDSTWPDTRLAVRLKSTDPRLLERPRPDASRSRRAVPPPVHFAGHPGSARTASLPPLPVGAPQWRGLIVARPPLPSTGTPHRRLSPLPKQRELLEVELRDSRPSSSGSRRVSSTRGTGTHEIESGLDVTPVAMSTEEKVPVSEQPTPERYDGSGDHGPYASVIRRSADFSADKDFAARHRMQSRPNLVHEVNLDLARLREAVSRGQSRIPSSCDQRDGQSRASWTAVTSDRDEIPGAGQAEASAHGTRTVPSALAESSRTLATLAQEDAAEKKMKYGHVQVASQPLAARRPRACCPVLDSMSPFARRSEEAVDPVWGEGSGEITRSPSLATGATMSFAVSMQLLQREAAKEPSIMAQSVDVVDTTEPIVNCPEGHSVCGAAPASMPPAGDSLRGRREGELADAEEAAAALEMPSSVVADAHPTEKLVDERAAAISASVPLADGAWSRCAAVGDGEAQEKVQSAEVCPMKTMGLDVVDVDDKPSLRLLMKSWCRSGRRCNLRPPVGHAVVAPLPSGPTAAVDVPMNCLIDGRTQSCFVSTRPDCSDEAKPQSDSRPAAKHVVEFTAPQPSEDVSRLLAEQRQRWVAAQEAAADAVYAKQASSAQLLGSRMNLQKRPPTVGGERGAQCTAKPVFTDTWSDLSRLERAAEAVRVGGCVGHVDLAQGRIHQEMLRRAQYRLRAISMK